MTIIMDKCVDCEIQLDSAVVKYSRPLSVALSVDSEDVEAPIPFFMWTAEVGINFGNVASWLRSSYKPTFDIIGRENVLEDHGSELER